MRSFRVLLLIVAWVLLAASGAALEKKEGLPKEDEFSRVLKYKTGYRAYMISMYAWFLIFVFRDQFPNTESLVGGGILLSALIYFVIKNTEKAKFVEEQD